MDRPGSSLQGRAALDTFPVLTPGGPRPRILRSYQAKAKMRYRTAPFRRHTSRFPTRIGRFPKKVAALTFGIVLLTLGCNSDDSEAMSIEGTWSGTIAEADAEFTLILLDDGKKGIAGTALVTAPPEGQVSGTVDGTKDGDEVDFTIEIDDAIIGGSLVFEGEFQSEDVLSGTMGSGILGGSFPVTLQKQGV